MAVSASSWFPTSVERWDAVRDLHELGRHCILLLAETVEHQVITRGKATAVSDKLNAAGFVFINNTYYNSVEVIITPSLWGEEALSILNDLNMPKKLPELTPLQFDILRCAIRTAKESRVRTVAGLRAALLIRWPKKPKSINTALKFWANYEKSKTWA